MNETAFVLHSASEEKTEELGKRLAPLLKPGSLIALSGELAAGKTCFVRGFVSFFSDACSVSSPTFTIVNQYSGPPEIFHVDLYRTTNAAEVIELGYEELFDSGDALCLVEWAERAEPLLPHKRLTIHLEHSGGDQRIITLRDRGLLAPGWQSVLST